MKCRIALTLSGLGLALIALDALARWLIFWKEPLILPKDGTTTWTYEASISAERAREEGLI